MISTGCDVLPKKVQAIGRRGSFKRNTVHRNVCVRLIFAPFNNLSKHHHFNELKEGRNKSRTAKNTCSKKISFSKEATHCTLNMTKIIFRIRLGFF